MCMRFGTWNVRSMYRAGSLTAVAEEFSKYKLDLVGDPQRLTTLWAFTACYRDSVTYLLSGSTGGQMGLMWH
jgi:hypothetical protein